MDTFKEKYLSVQSKTLTTLRRDKGVTLWEVCDRCEMDKMRLFRLEKGACELTMREAYCLAIYYDLDLNELAKNMMLLIETRNEKALRAKCDNIRKNEFMIREESLNLNSIDPDVVKNSHKLALEKWESWGIHHYKLGNYLYNLTIEARPEFKDYL